MGICGGCEGHLQQNWRKAKIVCKATHCTLNPADSTPRPNEFCVIVHCPHVFLDFRKPRRA